MNRRAFSFLLRSVITVLLCLSFASAGAPVVPFSAPGESPGEGLLVFVGTYTKSNGPSKGIYAFRMDKTTGQLTPLGLAAESVNPSFVVIHPNGRFLYAANETGSFEGNRTGAVSAFAISPETGKLTFLNQQPSGGAGPCHLAVDRSGKFVLVANYSGGNVSVLPIEADGKLGPATSLVQHQGSSVNKGRQEGPHAHGVYLDAGNRFAVVTDLGLDKLLVYRFDADKGTLAANEPPSTSVAPGAGPRHFAFHPDGRHAYVINEIDSTLTSFTYDQKAGVLKQTGSVRTLPPDFKGENSTAEVEVHPSGRFVYGSNRGADSIVIFKIDSKDGTPALVGWEPTQGKEPRNFAIDPSGKYLVAANQKSDSLVVFRIDPETGQLTPAGAPVAVAAPVCVAFFPIK